MPKKGGHNVTLSKAMFDDIKWIVEMYPGLHGSVRDFVTKACSSEMKEFMMKKETITVKKK